MYLLIKLNPNALPGSQDARHQGSLKIIQLTILRLMAWLAFFSQNSLAFLTKGYPPPSTEQPWKSKLESGSIQVSSLTDLILIHQTKMMAATTCFLLPTSCIDSQTLFKSQFYQ